MKIFGLTGGSGTGKTTVANIFEENGIYVVRADLSAHRVEKRGTQCYDELVSMFGTGILNADGEIDRKRLGKIVFDDIEKLKILSRITHHYIKYDIIRELRSVDCAYAAIDGAVIIGSPVEELCEFIVAVEAEREERLKRIIARDGLSEADARARIAAQPDDGFYRSRAKYVIRNDGGYDELRRAVLDAVEKITSE